MRGRPRRGRNRGNARPRGGPPRVVRPRSVATRLASGALALAALSSSARATAEVVLTRKDAWELFTDGQVGAFFSWTHGDGFPQPKYGLDASGNPIIVHDVAGGGWNYPAERGPLQDPARPRREYSGSRLSTYGQRAGRSRDDPDREER